TNGLLLGRTTSLSIDDVPRPVENLLNVRGLATSSTHACVTTGDGRLLCWGAGDDAMLGVGDSRDEKYPVALSFPSGIWPYQVSVSESPSCVRMTNGTVACWGGLNRFGELAFREQIPVYVPTKVSGLPPDIVVVAVGLSSSCALTKEGVVWCWGDNRSG